MLHSNGESKSFGMGFGVISYMSKMFFCKISKRLINTSNKRLNNLYNPIANSHPTAVRETLKKTIGQKGTSMLLGTMPRTDHQTKSLNSYFFNVVSTTRDKYMASQKIVETQ